MFARIALILTLFAALPVLAQEGAVRPPESAAEGTAVSGTTVGATQSEGDVAQGGLPGAVQAPQDDGVAGPGATSPPAPTLEDILARQRGERVDPGPRAEADGNPPGPVSTVDALSAQGPVSDGEIWRAIRFNNADASTTLPGAGGSGGGVNAILVQDSGMPWLQFREGPLLLWGGLFLLAALGVLALVYLVAGRMRIDAGKSGRTVKRFGFVERVAHWTVAGSFILLSISGLLMLWGRSALIPLLGKDAYANLAMGCIWIHNNIAWAFMLGLVVIFALWVLENIPNRHDLVWLRQGGGIFNDKHPPAKKFNAGQKMIFWVTIVLGASISASGLSLLFPFEFPMFAKTFAAMNWTGIPELIRGEPLPTELTPHAEMQLSQAWHAIVAFLFIGLIFAHIYIGSVGMEGAFWAMGTGEVDEQWAKEHHNLWYDEIKDRGAEGRSGTEPRSGTGQATPAE